MYNFREKVAVVTGAAQGIGLSIAKRFAIDGASVALIDVNEKKLVDALYDIRETNKNVCVIKCDVSDMEEVESAFSKVKDEFGKIDILINNAGIVNDAMSQNMTAEQFDKVIRGNLYGAFYCVKQVLKGMREREYGRIISLSSVARYGNIGQLNYACAKAAILGYTKTLAIEHAAKGITVNCIAPGIIKTEMTDGVPEKVKKKFMELIPMKRFGQPEEVAYLAEFLASDLAAYISGQCIDISGGWH